MGAFVSRVVSCDEHVLETLKAEGDGLDTEHRLCRVAWSFDEKKEFCARTGFGFNPRVWLKPRIWSFSACISSLWFGAASRIFEVVEVKVWQWGSVVKPLQLAPV
jgi:ribosomal protein L37E